MKLFTYCKISVNDSSAPKPALELNNILILLCENFNFDFWIQMKIYAAEEKKKNCQNFKTFPDRTIISCVFKQTCRIHFSSLKVSAKFKVPKRKRGGRDCSPNIFFWTKVAHPHIFVKTPQTNHFFDMMWN